MARASHSVVGMNALPDPQARGDIVGYHGAVSDFKRRLIESTLHQARGNRTHAARTLGLQRTYLLRLIRELQVAAPPPPSRNGRTSPAPSAAASALADARVSAPVATSPAPAPGAAQPPSPRPTPPAPRAAASAFYPPARPPASAPARRVPRR